MITDFLFVIPLKSESAENKIRRDLRARCFDQILQLKSTKKVWLLGAETSPHPDFEAIPVSSISKEDRLFECGFLLEQNDVKARYLIRLDDDDLIDPACLDRIAMAEPADCFADKTHWFYDLSSGASSNLVRPWMPGVVVHAMHHAMTRIRAVSGSALAGDTNFLFATDHSTNWHLYYADKKVVWSPTDQPLYLKVISPRSESAGGDESYTTSYAYHLKRFGLWKSAFPYSENLLRDMKAIWTEREGAFKEWSFSPKTFVSRFLNTIKPKK